MRRRTLSNPPAAQALDWTGMTEARWVMTACVYSDRRVGRGSVGFAATLVLAAALALLPGLDPRAETGASAEESSTMTDIVQLTRAWLEAFPEGDFDAFPGEVAADFVLRLPFVPAGVPNEFVGREATQAALAGSAQNRGKLVFSDVVIRRTEDPELVLTTASGEARMNNGRIYRNEYIMLTRIRDGTVLEHVEYLNPLAVMESMATPSMAAPDEEL